MADPTAAAKLASTAEFSDPASFDSDHTDSDPAVPPMYVGIGGVSPVSNRYFSAHLSATPNAIAHGM